MSTLIREVGNLTENFRKELVGAKKAEISNLFDKYAETLENLLLAAVEGDAILVATTGSISKNKTTTELPDKLKSVGEAKAGQVECGVSMGLTKNLGNFESARFDCTVRTLREDNFQAVKDGIAESKAIASEEIQNFVTEVSQYIKDKDPK